MKKTEVNRRNFIKVMAGGSSIFLLPSVLGACSNGDSKIWLEGWNGPMADETDIRWIVLSYAILAANPHNTQPWIVDLTGPSSLDGTDKLMAVERQSLDENIQIAVQTPPISAGDHSTRGLALLSLQLERP